MPSNTVLISGPAVGVAQILIWSYFCVFLPPMSTSVRVSAFSFVGVLNGLLYSPLSRSLLSLSYGFNLQLVQLVGRFGSSSLTGLLPHCPWVSIVVLFPSVHVSHPLGFAPEAALEDFGLPQ